MSINFQLLTKMKNNYLMYENYIIKFTQLKLFIYYVCN